MWNQIVSSLDSTLQMMLAGLDSVWKLLFSFGGIVAALLILAAMLWAEVLDARDGEYVSPDARNDFGVRS